MLYDHKLSSQMLQIATPALYPVLSVKKKTTEHLEAFLSNWLPIDTSLFDTSAWFEAIERLDQLARLVDYEIDNDKRTFSSDAKQFSIQIEYCIEPLRHLSDAETLLVDTKNAVSEALRLNTVDRIECYSLEGGDVSGSTMCYFIPVIKSLSKSASGASFNAKSLNRIFRLIQLLDDLSDLDDDREANVKTPITAILHLSCADSASDTPSMTHRNFLSLRSFLQRETQWIFDELPVHTHQSEFFETLKEQSDSMLLSFDAHFKPIGDDLLQFDCKSFFSRVPPILCYAP
jgi:hypothetical protein